MAAAGRHPDPPGGELRRAALRLVEETPALDGGQLVAPTKPGLGLAFDQSAIKRYQVG